MNAKQISALRDSWYAKQFKPTYGASHKTFNPSRRKLKEQRGQKRKLLAGKPYAFSRPYNS